MIVSGAAFQYKLVNRSIRQALDYKSRDYGINLSWIPEENTPRNVRIVRPEGWVQLRDGDVVALGVAGGGYLKFQRREYGISLVWSAQPVYEWQIRTTLQGGSGHHVRAGTPVGLYNLVENDFLFYDPRQYGINLKWLRDEGKYNGRHWWQKVGDFLGSVASHWFHVIREYFWRFNFLARIDFLLSLLPWRLPKKMRMQFVVLRDLDGTLLLGDDSLAAADFQAQMDHLQWAVDVVKQVYWDQASIHVHTVDGSFIRFESAPAPAAALRVGCDGAYFQETFSQEAGRYYRGVKAENASGFLTGYAEPITCIVVKEVTGPDAGCSAGPLAAYVVVDVSGFTKENPPTTPAHEVGHCTGLWHVSSKGNLMYHEPDRGRNFTSWQIAIVRSSPHVTYF